MTILKKLLWLCTLLIAQNVFCQNNYSLKWYSADSNHLPQNSVKSIVPDKYGYIWLSTESGLVRYDGQTFNIYNSDNLPGLTADRLYVFSGSAKKDSITIRNEIEELIVIKGREAKVYNKPLKRYDYKSFKETVPSIYNTSKSELFRLAHDKGAFVIGNDSIRLFNEKEIRQWAFKYNYAQGSQFFLLSGNLYLLGNNSDYIKFDGVNPVHNKFMVPFKGTCEVFTNIVAQQAFLYSENKLFFIKENRGRLITYSILENFDLHKNNIGSLYFDEKNEILYMGSANKGLLIARKQSFRHNTPALIHVNGTNGVYYALAKNSGNQVLASTGEVIDVNGNVSTIDLGRYSDKYMLIKDQGTGDIWTKEGRTIYRLKKSSNFRQYENWSFDDRISVMTKTGSRIWVATVNDAKRNGELFYIDMKTNKPVFFLKLDFIPTCVYGNDNGAELWAGSRFGLHRIDIINKRVERIKQFKDSNIRSIYVKGSNEVWATSYNKGIMLYKDNKVTFFPPDKNQYLLTSHCIIEDNKGYFWITTNKGLFQAKKSDLFDYANKKINNIYYYYYDKNEGFTNNEFNGGCQPCGIILNNKNIFFPSIEGVVNFNTEQTKPIEPTGGIYIDKAVADTTVYAMPAKLVINRNFGRLTFYISSPYFGNLYNQDLEAKLEGGVTQDWVSVKDGNISFSTLPPGDYTLTVRKLRGFGSGIITEKLDFSIKPAFWQTRWFMFLMGIFGGLMLIVIIKLRIQYIRYKNILLQKEVALQTSQLHNTIRTLRKTQEDLSRQNANHKKLIKTITHDIKSPLKFMAITGKYVYNKLENNNANGLKAEIESIYTSSAQLYHFVDEFLEYAKDADNSESEPYFLAELVAEKISFFQNIALSKKIQLFNHISKKIIIRLNKHLVSIIIHNLLDNAIKNTNRGEIHFIAYLEETVLVVKIKDTGTGMSEELIAYYKDILRDKGNVRHLVAGGGMGMQMVLELLIIMDGDMEIEASKDKGTEFILTFKI